VTPKEFSSFVMALRTYYSKENILPNEQAIKLWYEELKDIPSFVADAALRKWVATNKWSPTIAEIRATATEIQTGDDITWGESWRKLKDAVRRFGIDREQEALASFDPITRKVVQYFGYREFCISSTDEEMAQRAHFQRIFETVSQREKTDNSLPPELREAIGMIQQNNGQNRIGSGLTQIKGIIGDFKTEV
jgi:hypothetical protein